jgi:hypothetical protein
LCVMRAKLAIKLDLRYLKCELNGKDDNYIKQVRENGHSGSNRWN